MPRSIRVKTKLPSFLRRPHIFSGFRSPWEKPKSWRRFSAWLTCLSISMAKVDLSFEDIFGSQSSITFPSFVMRISLTSRVTLYPSSFGSPSEVRARWASCWMSGLFWRTYSKRVNIFSSLKMPLFFRPKYCFKTTRIPSLVSRPKKMVAWLDSRLYDSILNCSPKNLITGWFDFCVCYLRASGGVLYYCCYCW